ncbi:macrolide family glycosyltransferase [Streptomyces sp. GS7]|uniref:macrolide family glycosyltransferase n=1 Tax=Streptomyces sp. GS7 TaxID=2692234 RepID=UPI001317A669|nr:macrolide family glycosyltransferase [Streptomyces sp. GS7]QHC20462.1 glycosyl transferase [Streptomyces sp. GS7]
MSGHVLIVNVPVTGHVLPTLPVTAELVRRGCRVSYVTAAPFADQVRATGAEVLTYPSLDPGGRLRDASPAESVTVFLEENIRIIQAVEDRLGGLRPEERVDLVAYDGQTFQAGRVLAAKWGLPAVQLNPVFASNEHYSFMQEMAEGAGAGGASPEEMAEYGRRNAELLAEHRVALPVLDFLTRVEDFHVVFVPRALQPKEETFDERFAFVGPCLDGRGFLGEWRRPAGDRPVALISQGTTYNDNTGFFRACLEAFEGLDWHLVISVGPGADPAALGPLPPHVEVHQWVPHLAVLEHASVFVSQGGMGSLTEALYQGCPMVVVPHSPSYLPSARRVAELGIGEVVRPEEVDAARLRTAVLALTGDEGVLRRVADLRRQTREAGGAVRAADEITAYLRRARTTAPR